LNNPDTLFEIDPEILLGTVDKFMLEAFDNNKPTE